MYAEVILNAYDAFLAEQQESVDSPVSSRPSSSDTTATRPKKIRQDSDLSLKSPSSPGAARTPPASRRKCERAYP